MNILQVLQRFRDDLKTWVTINLEALDKKIDEKTLPVDTKLSSTSKNPVQNKVINAELSNLKDLVGNTSVANQINTAIAKQPHFSGDYNDLVNAPNIAEDDSGELTITDEEGNVIIKIDAEGLHTTGLTLDDKPAASKDYVDKAIATNVDFTGYATEKLVEQAIENVKKELSESIVSEEADWKIVDNSGNIIFKVDADGLHTTDLSLNGEKAATETYVDEAIAEIPTPDVSGQINTHNISETAHEDIRQAIETTKEELSESIVSNSDEWKVVDEAGNIIFGLDESGAHTTSLTVNGESVATETYVDEAIANIDFPITDLNGYATETYVDNKIADLVNSAPEALDTLGELAAALDNHEDAYDALLETIGNKATKSELEELKTELSESIISESDEWKIVDNDGNIIASIDANGVATTTVTAQNVVVNGDDVEEHISNTDIHVTAAEKASWNNKSEFSGSYNDLTDKPEASDLSNYYTKEETDQEIETAKNDLSESITSESDDWQVADSAGNIILSVSAEGAHTTNLLLNGEPIEGIIEEKIAQNGSGIYKQNEEPENAPDGTLWIDLDAEGSGAGVLPAVDSSNNGQFLRVINGAWAAASIQNAEEATF